MSRFSQGHALLVGVGGDLPGTVQDAQGLAQLLIDEERCAYPPAQVITLTAEDATRPRILAALDDLSTRSGAEDTVIVYFSGHGYRVSTPLGLMYFLMPHGYDVANLTETAILGNEFRQKLAQIQARKLLVLLDCCHSGGMDATKQAGFTFAKAPLPAEAEEQLAAGQGRAVIASSKADELSYAGKPYSAFTLALMEALCGKGVSKEDGFVRMADLALHARQMVPRRTADRQHPILNFDQADNFAVA